LRLARACSTRARRLRWRTAPRRRYARTLFPARKAASNDRGSRRKIFARQEQEESAHAHQGSGDHPGGDPREWGSCRTPRWSSNWTTKGPGSEARTNLLPPARDHRAVKPARPSAHRPQGLPCYPSHARSRNPNPTGGIITAGAVALGESAHLQQQRRHLPGSDPVLLPQVHSIRAARRPGQSNRGKRRRRAGRKHQPSCPEWRRGHCCTGQLLVVSALRSHGNDSREWFPKPPHGQSRLLRNSPLPDRFMRSGARA